MRPRFCDRWSRWKRRGQGCRFGCTDVPESIIFSIWGGFRCLGIDSGFFFNEFDHVHGLMIVRLVPCSGGSNAGPSSALHNTHLFSQSLPRFRSIFRTKVQLPRLLPLPLAKNIHFCKSACHAVVTKLPAPPNMPDGRQPPAELPFRRVSSAPLCRCKHAGAGAVSTGTIITTPVSPSWLLFRGSLRSLACLTTRRG